MAATRWRHLIVCVPVMLLLSVPLVVDSKPTLDDSQNTEEDYNNPLNHQASDSQQYGAGDVEQIVHGNADVHDASLQANDVTGQNDVKAEFGAVDIEHVMHGGDDAHAHKKPETNDQMPQSEPFGAGDVEQMVHGNNDVHDASSQQHDVIGENDVKAEFGAVDVEHIMHGSHDAHDPHKASDQPAEDLKPFGAGSLEEMVHGDADVHDTSSQQNDVMGENDVKVEFGALDMEHVMHGNHDVHGKHGDEPIKTGQFEAGNVEEMVHGKGHVHDEEGQGQGQADDQAKDQGAYSVGDMDVLKLGTFNVHDPTTRAQIDAAGDLSAFMGGGGGEAEVKGAPTVIDSEHLMHGEGGHDHDVKQLKDLKTQDADTHDRFQNLHDIIMHGDDQEHGTEDDTIQRGKKITYKDIMDLGLDETALKGIDLRKLLLSNEREYDDWIRDKEPIKGESPEGSFWERLGELRRRYLSFGRNDGQAKDLTGTKLDPDQQKWVSGVGVREGRDGQGEDSVMHEMELLGNTGARSDRHKDVVRDKDHANGRDLTDL